MVFKALYMTEKQCSPLTLVFWFDLSSVKLKTSLEVTISAYNM